MNRKREELQREESKYTNMCLEYQTKHLQSDFLQKILDLEKCRNDVEKLNLEKEKLIF